MSIAAYERSVSQVGATAFPLLDEASGSQDASFPAPGEAVQCPVRYAPTIVRAGGPMTALAA
jgi:hypothetical protein